MICHPLADQMPQDIMAVGQPKRSADQSRIATGSGENARSAQPIPKAGEQSTMEVEGEPLRRAESQLRQAASRTERTKTGSL